jgi:hypothetical protein
MSRNQDTKRSAALAMAVALITVLSACGGKKEPAVPAAAPPAATADTAAPAPAAAQPAAPVSQILTPNSMTWTPEAMEDLLAPVALYPDVVLGQVLVASTNPQEVLDAGNWLLQNQSLQGNALDEAAKKVGFTPPIRGLLQSPEAVDMMCSQLDWTTELGQAFVNDQQGVLDAVQRLRAQARDVGNLKSSDKMTVGTETQEGKQVITVSPPSSQVVYVPQYDPVAAYAPPPAAPATTTTTTTTTTGHSTGALVATGLLSFGAGILVANIFNDDDDDYYRHGYYNPRYYGPPMPYYPPYPYRPVYGGGYHQNNSYYRPPGYGHSYNNNTVIINNNTNNNYWNRHSSANRPASGYNTRSVQSPITAARPNRPELNTLNAQASQRPKRQAPPPSQAYQGRTGYAGAAQGAKSSMPNARPEAASAPSRDLSKPQGSYAGAKPAGAAPAKPAMPSKVERPSASPAAKPATSAQRPAAPDRSMKPALPPAVSKPAPRPAATPPKVPQGANPEAAPSPRPSMPSKQAAPASKPSAPTAKPNKPKAVPPKPKSVPVKPQQG